MITEAAINPEVRSQLVGAITSYANANPEYVAGRLLGGPSVSAVTTPGAKKLLALGGVGGLGIGILTSLSAAESALAGDIGYYAVHSINQGVTLTAEQVGRITASGKAN